MVPAPSSPCSQAAGARVEKGDPTVAMGAYAMALFVLAAIAEIGRALGPSHPLAHRGIDALALAQREDGGWARCPGEASTPSATGLALTAVARRHPGRIDAALTYLVETQRPDGTWPGTADMYGPRPLLSHFTTHTQAFVVGGIMTATAAAPAGSSART